MSASRQRRRERIIDLVAQHRVMNQDQLQQLLRDEGLKATQATISRDLRDLGITKGPSGYVRMTLDQLLTEDLQRLREVMRADVESVLPAGTLLVLRTRAARAAELGTLIERADLPQCIGVIAGEDAVFIATRSVGQATELGRMLQHLKRRDAAEL